LRILLTGRHGQVGWDLERALPTLGEVIPTDRTTLDLSDPDAIRRVVRQAKPDLIVNAAAYTAVDKAESEPELATQVNAIAPGVLAEEAKRLGALLVHYSTDYVFNGERRSPYAEDDVPSPLSRYGCTKLDGEQAIAASGCRYLTIRTSWVYSPRATNFYQIILRKARANESMRMVDDQTSVPTSSAFLAFHTIGLLQNGAEGLLHLVPSGQATRLDFARAVVEAHGSRSKVEGAKTTEFPAAARRPAYSVMSNAAAAYVLGRPLPKWMELLSRL
jgi:dTDP-4-dehydrorhamnose reductase